MRAASRLPGQAGLGRDDESSPRAHAAARDQNAYEAGLEAALFGLLEYSVLHLRVISVQAASQLLR